MLASWLRIALMVQALLCWGAAMLLHARFGISDWAVAGLGLALFVALNAIVPVTTCVLAWISMRRHYAPIAVSRPRLISAAIGEWLAYFALFVVIQPFAGWWMPREADAIQSDGRPVLLVHGYLCNRAVWWWLARSLRKSGLAVSTVDLEPPLAGIDELVERLHQRIEHIARKRGGQKIVLICHSMGGLVARAYLRKYGSNRVARLVTLGTPHEGTQLARLGLGRNARQMQPGSAWIRQLNHDGSPEVPTVAVWSASDNFVLPQAHARLAGAREHAVPDLGHLAMAFSSRVLRVLLDELAEELAAVQK